VLQVELSDPMSGFFMIRRDNVDSVAPKLATDGFKVLFDIVACRADADPHLGTALHLQGPEAGDSKLDNGVVVQYLGLLTAKLTRDAVSPRFLMFALVGASGVGVNLVILKALLNVGLGDQNLFAYAQAIAALGAMTSNYLINNSITYRDRRKRGLDLIVGYFKFCILCSVPLAANVAVANLVYQHGCRLAPWRG